MKSDFFANISHEFRTPLSLIMAPLKEKMEVSVNQKEQEEYGMMYRNADHLFNLINQLLDLSKLENGKIKLEKSVLELSHFFKIIAASFSSLAEYRHIDFSSEIQDETIWVELDQDIIQKICYNLLSNAFKFTPEDGCVLLKVEFSQPHLKITISDTGSGIPIEDQDKVFNRFFQSSHTNQLGTGIGLALTKELVEFHQGKIRLSSTAGKGTTFFIEIPVDQISAPDKQETAVKFNTPFDFNTIQNKNNGHGKVGPLILIIEDNPDLRGYLGELFQGNYIIHKSHNGAEGIQKAMEIIPDLIICDVMMPEKDGMEVCEALKKAAETNHIPIILLTAKVNQESKLHGLTIGADDYLSKPFDPKELKIRVSNLLEQRRILKAKYAKLLLLQPDEIEVSSSDELFLKKVMGIVSRNMEDSEFTVDKFSLEVGMSRMQLHRKLSALTGYSSMTFVRHQRLHRATQLLIAGEPVSQVAYAVGFAGLSSFTRAFKKEFHVAPSEYKG
jgi:DNA-binding response OmpR family regulator/anti-sigma regulatory factor (Ser/Thr protein kinase)